MQQCRDTVLLVWSLWPCWIQHQQWVLNFCTTLSIHVPFDAFCLGQTPRFFWSLLYVTKAHEQLYIQYLQLLYPVCSKNIKNINDNALSQNVSRELYNREEKIKMLVSTVLVSFWLSFLKIWLTKKWHSKKKMHYKNSVITIYNN